MAKWNKRIEFQEKSYYHVYNRWLWKQIIFHNDKEFERFYKLIVKYLNTFKSIKIVSYCLLPNHFHFIIKNIESWYILSDFMKRLQWAYATWFRILYPSEFKQPVFEWRFKAKLIDNDDYLNQCIAYVNFNQLKHEIVDNIDNYKWTSYHQIDKKKIEKYKDLILEELEM
jgi:REP element-mobilizing transposase RayT